MRLKITDNGSDVVEYLLNERHDLQRLDLDKVSPTLLSYLDECVTCHVLDTIVSLCREQVSTYNHRKCIDWGTWTRGKERGGEDGECARERERERERERKRE